MIFASFHLRKGWIEKYGTGIKRVCNLFSEYKLPAPEFKTLQNGLYVKIQGIPKTTQETTQETALRIIALLRKNPTVTRKQLAQTLGNITEDGVKYQLDRLKKQQIITRIGSTKSGFWKVNKAEGENEKLEKKK